MKVENVEFQRCQRGWLCKIGFRFTSSKQFTDEYQVVEAGRRFWIMAFFAAHWQARFHVRVHGAKSGERQAKGWAA